jgi:hypothetical protein
MHVRVASLVVFGLAAGTSVSALAQSVISTHSGIVYFFDGSVYLVDQRLEQKFGRFPDIGEGNELRTENGRAEVLLTPGVFLRVAENSSMRILSAKFSDTRVELLGGSAILEANEPAANTSAVVIYKQWQVRLPQDGACRIDSQPPQVIVYKGDAEVSVKGEPETVAVLAGQTLPLTSVLVPEYSTAGGDGFKGWAMSRSQAVSSDNATAAGIVDDPNAIENSASALGGISYFPLTGIPGVAITNPYGLSFWSPYQSTLGSIYFPAYSYGSLYPTGWPAIVRLQLWRQPATLTPSPVGGGVHSGGITSPRPPYNPVRIPHPVAPHSGPRPSVRR